MTTPERIYRERKPEGHWFDPNTMKFFRSRVHDDATVELPSGVVLFVTSEQPPHGGRSYSVRRMSLTGNISNVGEFPGHGTLAEARAALRKQLSREVSQHVQP